MEISIGLVQGDGSAVLRCVGEIDCMNASQITGAVAKAVANGATHVTLDLSRVTFCDSTCVRALLDAKRHCGVCQRVLTVWGLTPPVRRVLELTGALALLGAD